MIVKLAVSKKVKELIETKHKIINAKTNFNSENKKEAYLILKEKSKKNNFFFSFKVDSITDKDALDSNLVRRDGGCVITLNIPDNEVFCSGYYNFSDLIFFTEFPPETEEDKKYLEYLKTDCLKGTVSLIEQENLTYGLVQVIFKYIDIDWIIKIEEN